MGSPYSGYPNGRVGQIEDTFTPETDIIKKIRNDFDIIDFKGFLKLGIQAPSGTIMKINDRKIKIGKTGIYELDYCVLVYSLFFDEEVTALIDFVY